MKNRHRGQGGKNNDMNLQNTCKEANVLLPLVNKGRKCKNQGE